MGMVKSREISQGDVLWAADPFKQEFAMERPLIVISNDTHPFRGEQWVAVAVSTTARPRAIELTEDVWLRGSLPQQSYAYPWAIVSPRIEQLEYVLGSVADTFVERLVDAAHGYIEVSQN